MRLAAAAAKSDLVTSNLILREATEADMDALGRMGAMLVEEHHEFDPKRFIAPLPDLARRYGNFLVSQAQQVDKIVLVAELEGEVVGYAYAGVEGNDYMVLRGPAGEVYDLVIYPSHRRQGIGSRLLQATLDALARHGAPRAVLFTAAKNKSAEAMFAKAGFRCTMVEMTRELGGQQP